MSNTTRMRVFLTGVGGQGTLTATKMLAWAAIKAGHEVTAGEIHGMAQRGGIVESTVLIGGYSSPRVSQGEAHVLLGFEPLETLRALPYLAPGGAVVANSEPVQPIGVSLGQEDYPSIDEIIAQSRKCAPGARFVPCLSLGRQAGAVQAANMVLLGAMCSLDNSPVTLDTLKETIKENLKPALVDMNLEAVELGRAAVAQD